MSRMAPTWAQLQQMSDEDLVAEHDRFAGLIGREALLTTLNLYRDEITRRGFERSASASHELARAALEEARASRRLARWNMVVAVVAAAAAVAAILVPFVT